MIFNSSSSFVDDLRKLKEVVTEIMGSTLSHHRKQGYEILKDNLDDVIKAKHISRDIDSQLKYDKRMRARVQNILLLGIEGSGKGAIASKIKEIYNKPTRFNISKNNNNNDSNNNNNNTNNNINNNNNIKKNSNTSNMKISATRKTSNNCKKHDSVETYFRYKGVDFRMFEGGAKYGKWFHHYSVAEVIIFVVDLNSFDQYTPEEENKLIQSLNFFASIWFDLDLYKIPIMLLLNKEDALKEKIILKRSRIEDHFPDYVNYTLPKSDGAPYEGDLEFARAKCYIRDSFMKVTESKHKRHSCYVFFTSIDDVESIRAVVKSYSAVYEAIVLRRYGLL